MKHRNEIDRCENCEFAEYDEGLKSSDISVECRRHAPTLSAEDDMTGIWPLVNRKQWCGDFERRNHMSNGIVRIEFIPKHGREKLERYQLYQKMINGDFLCQSCGANKQHFVKDRNAPKELGAPRIAIRCNGCEKTSPFYCSVLDAINNVFSDKNIFKGE